MHHVEVLQARAAETFDGGIPAHCPVTRPCRKIDGLNAIFMATPAKRRSFCRYFPFLSLHAFFQAPVGGEHGYLMAPLSQTSRKGAYLDRGAAELEERCVGFCNVQDSHCSRRIFFSDFAKALNRNSCSARWRPRAPISFA